MSAITKAIAARMKGDTTLTGLLGTYAGEPCVFSTNPVPASAPRPYVYLPSIVSDVPMDTKTEQIREHTRDIVSVTDANGDASKVEAIADRVRALFHRVPLTVEGFRSNMIAEVFGPSDQPSDTTLYARRCSLRLTLVQ